MHEGEQWFHWIEPYLDKTRVGYVENGLHESLLAAPIPPFPSGRVLAQGNTVLPYPNSPPLLPTRTHARVVDPHVSM